MAGTDRSQNTNFEKPCIILNEVQLAENLGMVLRAMLNFGFKNLRLVNPKVNFANKKTIASSAGAYDIISNNIKVFNSLEACIEDIECLCATSVRKRDLDSFVGDPKNTNTIGFLFGPEKAGLKNSDLALANMIINIPTNKAFGSLNLAMSVNIICYEWYLKNNNIKNLKHFHEKDIAKKKEVTFFSDRLIQILHETNFFINSEDQDKLKNNLKNIFFKNNLTNKELRILHGVITNIKKDKKSN
jgi:tRNA/rRNA methyltransferase